MNIAVIKTGGKQYKVSPGQKIQIEKTAGAAGDEVVFDEVLLVSDDKKNHIGAPRVAGAKVKGKILEQGRDTKVTILKYKSKKRQSTKRGHRQPYSMIEIQAIEQN